MLIEVQSYSRVWLEHRSEISGRPSSVELATTTNEMESTTFWPNCFRLMRGGSSADDLTDTACIFSLEYNVVFYRILEIVHPVKATMFHKLSIRSGISSPLRMELFKGTRSSLHNHAFVKVSLD